MANENESSLEYKRLISPTTYRHSIHLIPLPGTEGKPPKRYEPFTMKFGMIIGVPLLILALGFGLETAIVLTDGSYLLSLNFGFKVPQNKMFQMFGNITPQFLASFVPTLVVLPVAIAWRELDWNLRRFQPYLVLNKGNARAGESLLLDYISLGPPLVLYRAMRYKHGVIFWSSLTATLTYLYQPLAGSVFQIQQHPQIIHILVTSTKSILLSPPVQPPVPDPDPNAFIASAGYVDSSVLLGLLDPPFIFNGWATAVFEIPKNLYLNGSMTVNTTGVQTNVTCSNPSEPPILTPVGTTSFNLSSKSIDGCVHSVSFNSTGDTGQYGVDDIACPGNASTLDSSLRPVMFWFSHVGNNNAIQATTIFCKPTIQALNVQAVADLNTGTLSACSPTGNFVPQNNATGAVGVNGHPYNGLIFNSVTNLTLATRSIIPGAIFHSAQRLPNGLQSAFDLPNGFLNLTTKLYTRYLATSALSMYFLSQNTPINGTVVSLLPILKIAPIPAHFLAVMLILTGFSGVFIQVISQQQRKRLLLATPPGSIASIISLTSRSGFGELLLPYDDEQALEKKLNGLRFRLDQHTGAIVADEVDTDRSSSILSNDATMSSLEKTKLPEPTLSMSSSDFAYAFAAGKIPPSPREDLTF